MEQSWLPIPPSSDFSLANIPFGIITTPSSHWPHPAIAIGEYALDLFVFSINDGFSLLPSIQPYLSAFTQLTLNEFASLGRPVHREVRSYLQDILEEYTPYPGILKDNSSLRQKALFPLKDVQMHLPLTIGDYTDFYAGLHHAYNVGLLFRGPDHALQPNYTHLPVGYHGRASSVVLSGTPIRRPWGQIIEDPNAEDKRPIMKPCRKLDIELEVGAFICKPSNMGEPIPIPKAHEHVFGLVLMNDWSARDIQAWEYVPLGPFGSKNFGTSISPWIVLADALEQFRVEGLDSGTTLLPYLKEEKKANVYDITLEVDLTTAPEGTTTTISRTNSRNLLFSFPQMVAHHSITGCPMRVGDLLGSGTISGDQPGTQGSLLEQTQNGKTSLQLEEGVQRRFLEDGDAVTIRGWCQGKEGRVGFGECTGRIERAAEL